MSLKKICTVNLVCRTQFCSPCSIILNIVTISSVNCFHFEYLMILNSCFVSLTSFFVKPCHNIDFINGPVKINGLLKS